MNFGFSHISLQNLFSPDFNAVNFSLTGMLVVFTGLLVISIYIFLQPFILALPDNLKKKKSAEKEISGRGGNDLFTDKEVLIAIAVAFHLDRGFSEENQRITWKPERRATVSAWQIGGQFQGVSDGRAVMQRRP
ncbi:MAG: OadG family protein [Thermodesulfobacteriota bacterium]|nr:OadG family protein [Thermodesulfobacteriota bacterium]